MKRILLSLLALPVLLLAANAFAGEYGEITAEEIQKLVKTDAKSLYLLDVRTPREYAGGHMPGAVLVPIDELESKYTKLPRDKKIIAICAVGGRSAAAHDFLKEKGFPWVKNYSGGMMDWKRRGLPMDTGLGK